MAYLIGTAGHVDHGKTSLIAALTGIDADRLPEEKARGLTIDIGFAHLDVESAGRVGIVDVPGHEKFIKNMLAGASGVDVALLCVAADEGIKPQTREHFQILEMLEVKKMVVAITKCDAADDAQIGRTREELDKFLRGTEFESSKIVNVSSKTGEGLEALKSLLNETIASLPPRPESKDWILPIDRVFSVQGHGTVVTGTVASGCAKVADEPVLAPGNRKVRIRSIQTYGEPVQTADAGSRAAMNIVGAEVEELHRGHAIGSPGFVCETRCINVRIHRGEKIRHGERIRAHIGAGEFIGRAYVFETEPGVVQIRFEETVACAPFQKIVIRRYAPITVLAGGTIVTPNASKKRKREQPIIARSEGTLEARVLQVLQSRPEGVETNEVCEALGLSPQALGDPFEVLKSSGEAVGLAGVWFSSEHYETVCGRVQNAAMEIHNENPTAASMPKTALMSRAKWRWNAKAFDRLIARMNEERKIDLMGSEVRHPEFTLHLSEKQSALLSKVLKVMEAGGAVAPSPDELAAALGVPVQAVKEIRRLGIAAGKMTQIDENLIYSNATLDQLASGLKELGTILYV
jgi:selenocysteine-specific elongation factor